MSRIVFITGTDTGVGKTVITCLLVAHLRAQGEDAVAIKPLCSGSREDIRRLRRAQQKALTEEEICPFYFAAAVTPMLGARRVRRVISLDQAARCVHDMCRRHAWVLVEGAGGLLSPLGEGWSAAEWISALRAEVIVVAADRLGAINHTLLTLEELRRRKCRRVRVVLNATGPEGGTLACGNERVLSERLGKDLAGRIPWLGSDPIRTQPVPRKQKIFKKVLARLVGSYTFTAAL